MGKRESIWSSIIHGDNILSVSVSIDCNQANLIPFIIVSNFRGLERFGHGLDLNS